MFEGIVGAGQTPADKCFFRSCTAAHEAGLQDPAGCFLAYFKSAPGSVQNILYYIPASWLDESKDSVTTVSQKSSMDLMTVANCKKSTGLVT